MAPSSSCSDDSKTPEQLSKKKGRYFEPEPDMKASSKDWYDLTKKYEELQDGLQSRLKQEKKTNVEVEDDPVTLMRREKQIEYGKNTVAYDKYIKAIPRDTRSKFHPRTPDRYAKCSRRSFDNQIKIWRKALHNWEQFTVMQKEKYLDNKKKRQEKADEEKSVAHSEKSTASSSSGKSDDKENGKDSEKLPLYDSDDSLDLLDDDDDLGFDF